MSLSISLSLSIFVYLSQSFVSPLSVTRSHKFLSIYLCVSKYLYDSFYVSDGLSFLYVCLTFADFSTNISIFLLPSIFPFTSVSLFLFLSAVLLFPILQFYLSFRVVLSLLSLLLSLPLTLYFSLSLSLSTSLSPSHSLLLPLSHSRTLNLPSLLLLGLSLIPTFFRKKIPLCRFFCCSLGNCESLVAEISRGSPEIPA